MNSIAIVGLGPRGSSLLERLITHMLRAGSQHRVEIFLFEKEREFGPGCHYTSLPEDLLTNTIAGQMTMYFGNEMEEHGPVHNGDCLFDWHRKNRDAETKVSDYLPRRRLGEYLRDFHFEQIARMEKHDIRFHRINSTVINVIGHDGFTEVHTEHSRYIVSQTILCIGHQSDDRSDDTAYESFLDYRALERIGGEQTIAIQGMGLTACDVISRLTEGRGGHYEKIGASRVRYIASGDEPKCHLFSRSGVFFSGRALNPDHNFIYAPRHFTREKIETLRRAKGVLDFEDDILPLLQQELQAAYAQKSGGQALDIDLFFHPEKRLDRRTQEAFRESFLSYLRWDIEHCALGKMDSAYKFCQDAIRDLRDQFRVAIDFRSLSDESYEKFITLWQPRLLKACVGPPYIRLMQIEALIEAGICSIDFALHPKIEARDGRFALVCDYQDERRETVVDLIVKASIPSLNLSDTANQLTTNLLRRFKPFTLSGQRYAGLEISRNYEVMHADGTICSNIYAFGIPSEGTKYFTLVLGRPNMVSTFLLDSNHLAKRVLDKSFTGKLPRRTA